MRNNLGDVNNYLFEQLERLNDDETLKQEDNFEKEIQRAKTISNVCSTIVQNANVILNAKKYADEMGIQNVQEIFQLKGK